MTLQSFRHCRTIEDAPELATNVSSFHFQKRISSKIVYKVSSKSQSVSSRLIKYFLYASALERIHRLAGKVMSLNLHHPAINIGRLTHQFRS